MFIKKFRAAWVVQGPVGLVVIPPRCTRRVQISMKHNTWNRRNVAVSTHAKSVAMTPLAWVRMNCAQVDPVGCRVGSIPAVRRIVQTVDAAIR